MTMLASQITSLTVVYSIVYSGVNQRKHQSTASLAFVREIHRDRWISRTNGQLRGNVSIWWRHHAILLARWYCTRSCFHYSDNEIISLTIVYLTIYSGADQRKHQSSASLSFVRRIHRWPVNSPYKGPVTRTIFPFDNVIMPIYFRLYDISKLISLSSVGHIYTHTHIHVYMPLYQDQTWSALCLQMP